MIRSKKIRESARGEDCTLRLPGCMNDTKTTVLAHSPYKSFHGGGISLKPEDLFSCYACSNCHDVLDGRKQMPGDWNDHYILHAFVRAMAETQRKFVEKGLIEVK